MKETAIVLIVEIIVISLSISAYKKVLNKNATKKQIVWLAVMLSIIFTVFLGFGASFYAMPWGLPAYIVAVFFLQWLVSQQLLDKIFRAFMKKRGYDIE